MAAAAAASRLGQQVAEALHLRPRKMLALLQQLLFSKGLKSSRTRMQARHATLPASLFWPGGALGCRYLPLLALISLPPQTHRFFLIKRARSLRRCP